MQIVFRLLIQGLRNGLGVTSSLKYPLRYRQRLRHAPQAGRTRVSETKAAPSFHSTHRTTESIHRLFEQIFRERIEQNDL